MPDSGTLQTALSIFALASLVGLGLLRGTVTNLRENLKDAREEIADKDRRLTAVEAENGRLRNDLDALGRVVTGEAHWTAIGELLTHHHDEASGHWQQGEELLGENRDLLVEIRDLLSERETPP